MNYFTEKTIFGEFTVAEEHGLVTKLAFGKVLCAGNYNKTDIIAETFKQLDEYFAQKRKSFNIPLNPQGTKYQQKIWSLLLNIPYGETRTYKEIAALAGNENSSRAVGGANHNNPIMILIPCHRVIGSNKSLTGYAYGNEVKEKLLLLEGATL